MHSICQKCRGELFESSSTQCVPVIQLTDLLNIKAQIVYAEGGGETGVDRQLRPLLQ